MAERLLWEVCGYSGSGLRWRQDIPYLRPTVGKYLQVFCPRCIARFSTPLKPAKNVLEKVASESYPTTSKGIRMTDDPGKQNIDPEFPRGNPPFRGSVPPDVPKKKAIGPKWAQGSVPMPGMNGPTAGDLNHSHVGEDN